MAELTAQQIRDRWLGHMKSRAQREDDEFLVEVWRRCVIEWPSSNHARIFYPPGQPISARMLEFLGDSDTTWTPPLAGIHDSRLVADVVLIDRMGD